ncbi:SDR family NAD(P)-dependent oxidoreductase [Bacillus sp. FJAT-27916]|uniref:SDR family NAD(P)-dependent oxidoreductase n=1 Tax=Bacillus sp. FJAT-27916 TaxID=1679169 RepID=UPI00069D0DB1|nr:SDR family NAD(P)-dependent oxidoreductase [Bacillus sp. FJAT-27916]
MSSFDNKVIVIKAAAGGIGRVKAKKLADEGAKLTLVDLNLEAVKPVVKDLGLEHDRVLAVQADVSKENQVKAYVDKTLEKFGKMEGFFNNADVEGITALKDSSS